jgi:hypothetical protein
LWHLLEWQQKLTVGEAESSALWQIPLDWVFAVPVCIESLPRHETAHRTDAFVQERPQLLFWCAVSNVLDGGRLFATSRGFWISRIAQASAKTKNGSPSRKIVRTSRPSKTNGTRSELIFRPFPLTSFFSRVREDRASKRRQLEVFRSELF